MIFFLVPVYNEEENIPKLFESFARVSDKHEVTFVFVDDCSTDNSVNLINTLFENFRFKVITKQQNGGPGHSFNLGFDWILEHSESTDLVVTLEADGTSDLSILSTMITLSSEFGFDLVLSSVYAQGGGFQQTSFFRKTISFWANIMLRAIFNVKVLTLSSFYRISSVALLRRIKDRYSIIIEQPGFVCMFEMVLKSINVDARIIEVPMQLKSEARIGQSKMNVTKTSKEYLRFIYKHYFS